MDDLADFMPEPEFEFQQDGPGLFSNVEEDSVSAPASTAKPTPENSAPLALYRRYRPDTFAEVIGQEHVTEPLMRALENNRVNHAYLFSGPRGCGKTTSARILARALNCAAGPTPIPCGKCQSCQDLARGGPGSIDVIEIDAASHGNVEEARDLRERAFFAPVNSRYKIYIIDEAHMVTPQGFNALLKVVEEPPAHVKFIFATTEPEKVLGTIRSRTHHYPFRLVPPKTLQDYLAQLCQNEGVSLAENVLPMVVRAGGGSVRDSLSVLDQLLGSAGADGVSYDQAAALLGYTPDFLLDALIEAIAKGDGNSVFTEIDRVIEGGQDPRRFAEDLLERLRNLIIIKAVPKALESGLVSVSPEQGEILQAQAQLFGPGELTRIAEIIAAGLVNLRGTTAPRLSLELMCARTLLPAASKEESGIYARLERLERRMNNNLTGVLNQEAENSNSDLVKTTDQNPDFVKGEKSVAPVKKSGTKKGLAAVRESLTQAQTTASTAMPKVADWSATTPTPTVELTATPISASDSTMVASENWDPAATSEPTALQELGKIPDSQNSWPKNTDLSLAKIIDSWPQILEVLARMKRLAWVIVSQNMQPLSLEGEVLTLAVKQSGAKDSFARYHISDLLGQACQEVLGIKLRVSVTLTANSETTSANQTNTTRNIASTTNTQAENRPTNLVNTGFTTGDTMSATTASQEMNLAKDPNPAQYSAQKTAAEFPEELDEDFSFDDTEIEDQEAYLENLLKTELGAELVEEN